MPEDPSESGYHELPDDLEPPDAILFRMRADGYDTPRKVTARPVWLPGSDDADWELIAAEIDRWVRKKQKPEDYDE